MQETGLYHLTLQEMKSKQSKNLSILAFFLQKMDDSFSSTGQKVNAAIKKTYC